MNIIKIPFGYLLDWLYQFTTNYGLALILFSLFVKLILLPMNIKSKKSMLKMSRLAPLSKALEEKYGDDKAKYQQELARLYKEEGISPGGGCLWSFLPLLILFPLYAVIRQPITYMLHVAAETSAEIVKLIGLEVTQRQEFYVELLSASHINEFLPQILEKFPDLAEMNLQSISFEFLGMNLAEIPVWKFWTLKGWNQIGIFLLPLISGGSHYLATFLNKKLDGSVATNSKGEKDKDAANANQTMNTMLYLMPLMSIWIGYSMPAAITVYWIAQSVFSLIIDSILTIKFRKVYAEEDEDRRRIAAQLEELQAEKERVRAARRAANPDGITENTSKKKLQQKQKAEEEAARAAAAKEYAARKGIMEEETENLPLSGVAERPYCKGRAYDPDRYNSTEE